MGVVVSLSRFCCSFLLSARTPHTFTLLQHWVSSHGRENFPELLQPGSYPQGAVLHELLQCGAHMGSESFQEPSAVWVSHRVAAFFRHLPSLPWSPPALGNSLSHHGLSVGCRKISALAHGASPPTPSLTLVSAVLFHLSIVPPFLWLQVLPISFFSYPVKSVIPGSLPQSLVGLAWPSQSWLALAMLVTGKASGSFSQKPPL